MQLNGLDIDGYSVDGNLATFTVRKPLSDIAPLQGTDQFRVTDDVGTDVEVFGGYGLLNLKVMSDEVTEVTIMRAMTPDLTALLNSTLANLKIVKSTAENAKGTAEAANTGLNTANNRISSVSEQLDAQGAAIEELAATIFAEPNE